MEIYNEKTKAFHEKNIKRQTFDINEKVWLYNSCLKLFRGKLRSRWDGPAVVVESFDNESVLISYSRSGKQFKVNGHRLKPYLTTEPPTLADKVNLHIPEVHEDVITVTPSFHRSS